MAATINQTSFTAGEFAPNLYSRTDLEKYKSGLALARNWIVDYRGGVSTRAGTRFIGQCKAGIGRPRLIEFIVSTIATYVIECGDRYFRFISNGAYVESSPGVPLEVTTPYLPGELPTLKYTQSANVLTLTHPAHPPMDLKRTSPTSFTLVAATMGAKIGPPVNLAAGMVNITTSPVVYSYVVTSVNPEGEESIASKPQYAQGEILDQDLGKVVNIYWDNIPEASTYNIYKLGPFPSGVGNTSTPVVGVYGYIGSSSSRAFTDNNIGPDYSKTPPNFQDPFEPGQVANVEITSPGSGYSGYYVDLIFTGDGTGAEGYGLVNLTTGTVEGTVLTKPGKGYTTCVVTDAGANTAVYANTLGADSGTYPSAVGYHQQRRVFGGTDNFPEAMVFSQPGSYYNFDVSPIALDTDAITISLASRQVNAIKHFVSMSTGLIVLTTGGGFLVSGGGPDAALTPTNISALPQASSGCNDLAPLVINYDVLYAQNRGAVVRDLAFNFYVQSYSGTDRSVLASHLFTGYDLQEWTYAEEPFRLVNVVRSDGTLLYLAYVPEQEIFGWTHANTRGYFRSVASIPEGDTNAVYVIVERLILNSNLYYVERFDARSWESVEDSWCLDSALDLPGNFPNDALNLVDDGGAGQPGDYIFVNATLSPFTLGNIGDTLWAGGGRASITGYINPNKLRARIVTPFPRRPEEAVKYAFFSPNEWRIDNPVGTISGLSHLEGQSVAAVVDGVPVLGLTVASGAVTLPFQGTKITVGLPFTCDLKTLRLNADTPETIQGKRKIVPTVTATVNNTVGLLIGPDFDKLVAMKEVAPTNPAVWYTNEPITNIEAKWDKFGQVAIRQSAPLPATVLGLIMETRVGDTAR